MKDINGVKYYPPAEEKINIISHGTGFILSIAAFVFLVRHAIIHGNVLHIVSFGVFGAGLIILYAASTFYHSAVKSELRSKLKIIDHASIYILIAGSYTPFTLVALQGVTGWVIFGICWGLALTGIILKLFFTGKYNLFSTVTYVLMGWIIVFAMKPLMNSLPFIGFLWLLAGGISYTIGAILYSIKRIKFNHAIFHTFVLIGSFCHFMSAYLYLLPVE